MPAPARHTNNTYHTFYDNRAYDDGDFLPGERIGPPPTRKGGVFVLRALVLLLIAGGSGWMLVSDRSTWPGWLQSTVAAFSSAYDSAMTAPADRKRQVVIQDRFEPNPTPLAPRVVPESLPLTPRPIVQAKPTLPDAPPAARPETPPLTTGSLPSAAERSNEAGGPLPTPRADPSDPFQVRAEAVGLHPRLSRALLERLSAEDYRNAGVAIKTALAETADDASFVWPRQRKPELALFKVHFVAGAASGCRRYVVTITKDRWSTTAFPMEKCQAPARHTRRN